MRDALHRIQRKIRDPKVIAAAPVLQLAAEYGQREKLAGRTVSQHAALDTVLTFKRCAKTW